MPDLQSELNKVLSQAHFDDEEYTAVTESVAQTEQTRPRSVKGKIFDYLKANPSSSYLEVANGIGAKNVSGVSAMLKLMVDSGELTRTIHAGKYCYVTAKDSYKEPDYRLHVRAANEARRVKAAERRALEQKAASTRSRNVAKATAVSKPAAVPLPENARFTATAKQLLDTMSITQARELYDELRKIFGS